jgi:hypothetical protein
VLKRKERERERENNRKEKNKDKVVPCLILLFYLGQTYQTTATYRANGEMRNVEKSLVWKPARDEIP